MVGRHDPFLVALSILIAVAAAYTALEMASRVAATSGRTHMLWLVAGSFAMGIGIWSMHFVGMLAFQLPTPIEYDVRLVALSALIGIAASYFALTVSTRQQMRVGATAFGGLFMGIAIAGMHYVGMAALRANARVEFSPTLVAFSVIIAISASCVALWLAHHYRVASPGTSEAGKAISALVMGGAIVGMHYTAMSAAHFFATPPAPITSRTDVLAGSTLAAIIALLSLLVLALALVASAIHRRVVIAVHDATRSSESALREQREFLRQVIDADPNLIFVKNYDGVFTLANRAMAQVYGTTPELLVGKTDADFNRHADQVERYLADDREVMTSRTSKFIAEEPFTAPDTEQTRWFQAVKVPLTSADGTQHQVLGVSTEVTERKQLADQLRQAQKMEAIGQLTGGIAHDLNNILTIILANADLIAQSLPDDADDFRRDFFDLQSAAVRGAAMVRKLLAFSRREMITLKPINLDRLCLELQTTLRRLLPASIDISLEADDNLPGTLADAGAVEQIMLNLATNARDAMPEGGLLVLSVVESVLDNEWCSTHGWGKPGRYVCASVSDTGTGIDPATRDKIFEPFFTTKPQGVGTGLGLSMVYGLMRQHDGYVDIYSEPSQGTTVRLYFPALLHSVDDIAAISVREIQRGTETVLIADDEEPIRRSATRVLERNGYTVHSASDGEEALRIIARLGTSLDLIISDVIMPRMGGRELYRQLREANSTVPFLYTSGYAAREVRESIALESNVPFLHKPWAMSDLLLKVREVLDNNH